MGHRHSRPIIPQYKPVQPPFQPIGCSGFTDNDYISENRLEKAPFLYYKIISKNYVDLQKKIIDILKNLPDPDSYNNPIPATASASASDNTNNIKNLQIVGNSILNVVKEIEHFAISNPFEKNPFENNKKPQQTVQQVSKPIDYIFDSVHDYIKNTGNGSILLTQKGNVYGPVYVLSAYDMENKNTESWLYFPSMTQERTKYPDLWFLANSNKWLFRILYSVIYRVKPFSSCQIHQMVPTDKGVLWGDRGTWRWYNAENSSYVYGCKSENNKYCKQSTSVHRAMGIYDANKNEKSYPTTYFRTYKLDSKDYNLITYFNPGSFNTLLMCFLQSDFEMFAGCRYMLVSPNRQFFYILESNKLILYKNLVPSIDILSLCHNGVNPRKVGIIVNSIKFKGLINTKMIIENGNLNIYSQITSKDPSTLIWSLNIVKNNYTGSCTLVLLDNGELKVFDNGNSEISSDNLNKLNNSLDISNNISKYDAMNDYKMRLIQLSAYMKLNNMIKLGGISSADEYLNFNKSTISKSGTEYNPIYMDVSKFDSNIDYINRITQLIDKFINEGKMTNDEKNAYLMKLLNTQKLNQDGIKNEEDSDVYHNKSVLNALGSSNNSFAGSLYNIADDGYGSGSLYNNPDGNGPNQSNGPDPYDLSSGSGGPTAGQGIDNYFEYSKKESDAQDKILKDKQKAKDDADSKRENVEDSLISGNSDQNGSGSGIALDKKTAEISNILGFNSKESDGIGSINNNMLNQSYAMGYNPDLPDMYNDSLTQEEIKYLYSNGMFDSVLDTDIRIKQLHQYLKKTGIKLYMPIK